VGDSISLSVLFWLGPDCATASSLMGEKFNYFVLKVVSVSIAAEEDELQRCITFPVLVSL